MNNYTYISSIRLNLPLINDIECIYYSIILILIYKTRFLIDCGITNIPNYDTYNYISKHLNEVQTVINNKYNIFNKKIIIDDKKLLEIIKSINSNNDIIINYDDLINEIFNFDN